MSYSFKVFQTRKRGGTLAYLLEFGLQNLHTSLNLF